MGQEEGDCPIEVLTGTKGPVLVDGAKHLVVAQQQWRGRLFQAPCGGADREEVLDHMLKVGKVLCPCKHGGNLAQAVERPCEGA